MSLPGGRCLTCGATVRYSEAFSQGYADATPCERCLRVGRAAFVFLGTRHSGPVAVTVRRFAWTLFAHGRSVTTEAFRAFLHKLARREAGT